MKSRAIAEKTPTFIRGTSCPISGSFRVSTIRPTILNGAVRGVSFIICQASRNAPSGFFRSCRFLKNVPLAFDR